MLLELKITNFVLIEEAHLSFDKGLTIFTGETGAGKSLLIKALKVLLGDKGAGGHLKPETETSEVSALFYGGPYLSAKLKELGYPAEEEIHIKRIISPQRQRSFLNGSPISTLELSQITRDLISLTSQHEYYTFLRRENQLKFVDELLSLKEKLRAYQNLYLQYRELEKEIKDLEEKVSQVMLKKDYLLFQISELEELNPDPEEEETLKIKRERLRHMQLIQELSAGLRISLDSAKDNLTQALTLLSKLTPFEPSFKERQHLLQDLYYEISELERDLKVLEGDLLENPSELEQIEARLARYERLKKKYGKDAQGLKNLKEELKVELELLDSGEEELKKLLREKEKLEQELLNLALNLREERQKGKGKIEDLIKKELKDLGMEKVEFEIKITPKEIAPQNLTSTGLDEIEFLFSPNPGLALRPLEKIASGGELSRIFLSFKTLLREREPVGTLIFDEVDAGIGGPTALQVGKKLKELSKGLQVLCITHLPQIACFADHHFLVEKHSTQEETTTFIKRLNERERLQELARMLGDKDNLELARSFLEGLNF
ncbi:hypothetical protein THC_0803 [Caldimicrobium thiodismutans]|uniref:DNA repair protein RecN n=1 Tax=Caldimicrobium thiodismutans TaxID=1653476 RepID=A0A0U4W280_9BACT|nr:DNA repair protein RecN [Caldimicrobium thiodismutans]BAU23194.1 hypothetical protein THC_0803 [Caldimicrobium thiodismutans]